MDFALHGDLGSSFALHPLAVPTALAQAIFAAATIFVTARWGVPWALGRSRVGRAALAGLALVFLLDVAFWIARATGAFGGPVPV